jgi:hypothetical protein
MTNDTQKMEYGPYIMTLDWLPITSEEDKAKAIEILCQIARDMDRSADFELTCVQSVNFRRE